MFISLQHCLKGYKCKNHFIELKKDIGMARIIEISYFARAIARSRTYGRPAFFDSHVISQKMASFSRLSVQGRDVRVSESDVREVRPS